MEILDRAIESALGISDLEMELFYDALFPESPGFFSKPSSMICLDYEKGGRSGYAASMGFNSLSKLPYMRVFSPFQEDSIGKSIADSFSNFSDYYRKQSYVVASGSGESKIPILNAKEDLIPNYGFGSSKLKMEKDASKTGVRKPTLNIITTSPETGKEISSILGEFVLENNGNLVLIDSRTTESKKSTGKNYLSDGIMEDRFELALNIITGAVSKGIVNSIDPMNFPDYYRELMNEAIDVKESVEYLRKNSEGYSEIVYHITDPGKKIILCGQGIGNTAAKFNNNRLGHVCGLANQLSDEYEKGISPKRNDIKWGSSPIQPDSNSLVVVISESGKKNAPDFIETAKKAGSECVLITRDGKTDYGHVLKIADAFYLGVNMMLTSSNIDAAYKLDKMGIKISEEAFRKVHVKDKIYH